jgi:hypothetical protein
MDGPLIDGSKCLSQALSRSATQAAADVLLIYQHDSDPTYAISRGLVLYA